MVLTVSPAEIDVIDAVIGVLIVVAVIAAAGRLLALWFDVVRVGGHRCSRPVRNVRLLVNLRRLSSWSWLPSNLCAIAVGLAIVIALFGWDIGAIPLWIAGGSFGLANLLVFLGAIGEGIVPERGAATESDAGLAAAPATIRPTAPVYCTECGTKLNDARFCQECGTAVRQMPQAIDAPDPSPTGQPTETRDV